MSIVSHSQWMDHHKMVGILYGCSLLVIEQEDYLALLKQNARLSDAQLAVMLGKTEAEVAAEIKQLEQDGVIKGYSVICNEELTNDDRVNAIIELRVTPQKDCGFEEMHIPLCSMMR